jgi:hypothetical protein
LLRALVAFHGAKINSRATSSSRGSDLFEQSAPLLIIAKVRR